MPLETGTYINSLNPAYPLDGDEKKYGDDHIRLFKSAVKATFPNIAGAVTGSHTAINNVTGVLGASADAPAMRTALNVYSKSEVDSEISDLTAVVNAGISGLNVIHNADFLINQRNYDPAVGPTSVGVFIADRWKVTNGSAGVFITAGSAELLSTTRIGQSVKGSEIETGTYTLSWTGTATAKIDSGSNLTSPATLSLTAGTDFILSFGGGTVKNPKLEKGSIATSFTKPDAAVERARCLREYEKSYDIGTAVGTATSGGCITLPRSHAAVSDASSVQLQTEKSSNPTITVYSTGTGSAGQIRSSSSADVVASVIQSGSKMFTVSFTSTGTNLHYFHYVAETGL